MLCEHAMLVLTSGFLVADIIAVDLPRVASPGEVLFTPLGIRLRVGGHPANVAINLVKLGLDPSEIGVVGAVGEDLFGDFIHNFITSYRVNVFLQRVPTVGTTKNLILVVKGEDRRFHVDLGASWHLDPNHVRKTLRKFKPKIFYSAVGITGLDLEISRVLKEARYSFTFINVVKPYDKGWDFILPALKYADAFHCNDIEAMSITGESNVVSALKELVHFGPKIVFVTKGERGAILMTKHVEIFQPPFKVRVVDPTGAGDAFCAGVIFKLMGLELKDFQKVTSKELTDILMYGQAVGAIACTGIGTTAGVSENEAHKILSEQKKKILRETVVKVF